MRRNTSQKGFTLIELLIVIAIIGILAAVLIPNLLAARTRAFDTATQSCGRAIATAQEIHAIDEQGAYAAAQGDLQAEMIAVCGDSQVVISGDVAGAYEGAGWTLTNGHAGTKVFTVSITGLDEVP